MSTAAERLAAFTSSLTLDRVPDAVLEAAKLHLLDTLGCGLAAHALGVADAVRAAAAEEEASGPASAIGVHHGVPAGEAALVNGTLCHALDFDDTHAGAVAHVSVTVAPAALATAEALGAPGREVLAAVVAGNEAVCRLGSAAGAAFHARGFHPTAICGVFGAAAAAARLRGLDAATTTRALGIAGSMASGLLEFLADGSSTKRLHPGWAAHAGVQAARLAAHGATGPTTVIEGRFGLYRAFLGREDVDVEGELADLGERWETPRIAFKPYPACHFLHASVDAAAQAAGDRGLAPGDIAEIVATVPPAAVDLVLEPLEPKLRPRTEYEAKFSLPYSVAARLVHGRVDVLTYTDAAIADPDVLELAGRVRYEVQDYTTPGSGFRGGVRIRTTGGETLSAKLDYQRGAPENPMSAEEVRGKYRTNAGLALDAVDAERLELALLGLEDEADLAALGVVSGARATREVAA